MPAVLSFGKTIIVVGDLSIAKLINPVRYRVTPRLIFKTYIYQRTMLLRQSRHISRGLLSTTAQFRLASALPHLRAKSTSTKPDPPLPSSITSSKSTLLQRHIPGLAQLSQSTNVSLPSLALSFLLLHEITAVVPAIAFYYLFASLGAGAGLVSWLTELGHDESSKNNELEAGWKHWIRDWYQEGVTRVDRIGRKYGVLGYEKQNAEKDGTAGPMQDLTIKTTGAGAAEKVANAVAAYVLVKVSLVCNEDTSYLLTLS